MPDLHPTLHSTVEQYWAAAETRSWDTFGALLAEDVVYELPQTRERIRGRAAYVRFNVEYPGDWHLVPERIIADGDQAVSWIRFTVGEERMDGVTFFTAGPDGLITTITDFWPETYEPPPGREHLTERY
jgi:hypothetical protein